MDALTLGSYSARTQFNLSAKHLVKKVERTDSMHLHTAVHDDQRIRALINPRLHLLRQLIRNKIRRYVAEYC